MKKPKIDKRTGKIAILPEDAYIDEMLERQEKKIGFIPIKEAKIQEVKK